MASVSCVDLPYSSDERLSHTSSSSTAVRFFPAMMVTDTSNFRYAAYHCVNNHLDEVKNLDLGFATQVTKMVAGATA